MSTDIKTTRLGYFGIFSLTVLVFSVARGLVPLLTANAALARPTYTLSFLLGLVLSLLGLYLALYKKNHILTKNLRLLLIINLALHTIWLLPLLIVTPQPDLIVLFVYSGLFPCAIFGFTKIPEKHLTIALAICTLLVAGTVILEFIELNTALIPNGFDLAIQRQLLLRPDNFEAFGNTAGLMRPVGIFGHRPHDGGNLLAILSAYWLALLFRKNSVKSVIGAICALSIFGMLMTQSAANIAAFFAGALFIVVANRRKIFNYTGTVTIITVVAIGAVLLFVFSNYLRIDPSMLWQWSKRFGSDGILGDMTALGIKNSGTDLLAVLIGHGSSFGLSGVGDVSEVGFIKMLMEFGVLIWGIFMTILIYPTWRYIASKSVDKQLALPYIAASLVGIISLWHYGSVLRTTNEFVFFALYAHALKILAKTQFHTNQTENERITKTASPSF